MGRIVTKALAVLAFVAFLPVAAFAQLGASGIAGAVRDTSGGVLPGVTVEAASPALIEKVRTVVADGLGQFRITDLRPGTYTVTFTLPGFSSVIREGLELPANFTATLNIELRVGAVAETVTVSGESPVVDVQNVVQQHRITNDDLDKIPTSKSLFDLTNLMPAVISAPALRGVGGNQGEMDARGSLHGGRETDQKALQDGMRFNIGVDSRLSYYINPAAAQEVLVEGPAGGSAEYASGGIQINIIPKDGGNIYSGSFLTNYTNDKLQSSNLTPELAARGLVDSPTVNRIHDVNVGFGGPIKREKIWFFTAQRHWGLLVTPLDFYENATPGTFRYTPDFSRPVAARQVNRSHLFRVTAQVSQQHKIAFSWDHEPNCACPEPETEGSAPEAIPDVVRKPNELVQATWSYAATNRVLVESGATTYQARRHGNLGGMGLTNPVSADAISILEQTTGFRYNAPQNRSYSPRGQVNGRASLSYVTGSHYIKAGMMWVWGPEGSKQWRNPAAMVYTFRNQRPTSLTQFASDTDTRQENKEFGYYLQDKWTLRRLTLNLGVRVDTLSGAIPARTQPAGVFIGARSFDRVDNVPNWKDVSPRFGVAYDLFGTGKTAVKASVGRYVEIVNPTSQYNPATTSVNQVNRTWDDVNGNFFPDCDLHNPLANGECLQINNLNFGRLNITTRGDPAMLEGWGNRGFNWRAVAIVDHELRPGFSLSAGLHRTWYGNFTVTDNLAVTPADFDPYCITAPRDSRLPNGGGYELCGFYNVRPDKFGQVNNLNTLASKYGKWTEVYNGADLNVTVRPAGGALLTGGLSVGNSGTIVTSANTGSSRTTSKTDRCFVVDSPQELYQCAYNPPYQLQVKFGGSYPLPWDLFASATFQSTPGPVIGATYTATNAQIAPSLGRNVSGGGTVSGHQLIEPFSMFEDRINTLDVRFSKQVPVERFRTLLMLDIYNAMNASSVLWSNSTYGADWQKPTKILGGRLFKVGLKLDW